MGTGLSDPPLVFRVQSKDLTHHNLQVVNSGVDEYSMVYQLLLSLESSLKTLLTTISR